MGSFPETYNADFCSSEGHKFISFFITVTCLPSLNKGVTLPYLRRYLCHASLTQHLSPVLTGLKIHHHSYHFLFLFLLKIFL